MASKDYLFVNKDSKSPSLSRNTGVEASLASRVNKHVQQQRFWKPSGPRRSWYRPFVRSDSSSSAPSPTQSDITINEDSADLVRRRVSSDSHLRTRPGRSNSIRLCPVAAKQKSRSPPQEQLTSSLDVRSGRGTWVVPPELKGFIRDPGSAPDAFNTIVVPLNHILIEVLQRHLTWVLSASISNYTLHEGMKRIFGTILQDKMRAAAFLAMASSQQKKIGSLTFPPDQGFELHSYKATKMIREHIALHLDAIPSYTLVDIFRLGLCEWMAGNHNSAKVHFSCAAQLWINFRFNDPVDFHVLEVCSCEDLLFAVDIDEKPLLPLNWLDSLTVGPQLASAGPDQPVFNKDSRSDRESNSPDESIDARQLEVSLIRAKSSLCAVLENCVAALKTFRRFETIDFGSALTGPAWIMKRRMHATLHRLQSKSISLTSVDEPIRRSLVIILILASFTAQRRVARTDMGRVAERLQVSLEGIAKLQDHRQMSNEQKEQLQDPGLWLWMYSIGLAAAADSSSQSIVSQWFRKRAVLLSVRLCGLFATPFDIKRALSKYLYFESALGEIAEILSAEIGTYRAQGTSSMSFDHDCVQSIEHTG